MGEAELQLATPLRFANGACRQQPMMVLGCNFCPFMEQVSVHGDGCVPQGVFGDPMRQPLFGLLVAFVGSAHARQEQLPTRATPAKRTTRLAENTNSEPVTPLETTGCPQGFP